ncbi:hypothetical protein [Streptomyces venezuelae]|uniref:hypothetical protein n=1 Tax=Streptomyces venezuelae TaxID=54571 RepID=UPI001687A2B2|nr:hypothetical protein [Streptomyces venezuelae]
MEALFELPTTPLTAWLDATHAAVPAEAETAGLDWDGFREELLDGPRSPSA